jgi:hypothetical protein
VILDRIAPSGGRDGLSNDGSLHAAEEKVSKRTVNASDGRALLDLLAGLRQKAERRIGKPVKVVVIQESLARWLLTAPPAESQRDRKPRCGSRLDCGGQLKRRRKTDALLRTLMAWVRGERRVCSMVRPPSADEELGAEGLRGAEGLYLLARRRRGSPGRLQQLGAAEEHSCPLGFQNARQKG